jgi:hypothetical protein
MQFPLPRHGKQNARAARARADVLGERNFIRQVVADQLCRKESKAFLLDLRPLRLVLNFFDVERTIIPIVA